MKGCKIDIQKENEKLQILFDYYVKLLNMRNLGEKRFNPVYYGCNSIMDNFFKKVVKVYAYDSKPKVLDSSDYSDLSTFEFYHGFEEYEFGRNFLQDENYHTGTGDEMVGFYSTKSFDEALCYTSGKRYKFYDSNRILNFKMCNDRKVILSEYLYKYQTIIECNLDSDIYDFMIRQLPNLEAQKINLIIEFIKNIDNQDLKKSFICAISESSIIATILGYDMIIISKCELEKYYIVLNRGKICIDKNSIKKFEEKAKAETKQLQ